MTLDELEKQKQLSEIDSQNETAARLGTGLALAIGSIGATGGYSAANQFIKSTQPDKIKDLKLVDVEGKPMYMTPDKANMLQAYQAPKNAGGGKGSFQAIQTFDPKTKKYGSFKFDTSSGEVTPLDVIVRPTPEKIFSSKDVQGTKSEKTYNQYVEDKKVNTINSEAGLGKHYDVATEGQGKTIEEGIKRGQEEHQKISDSLFEVKNAKSALSNTNDPRVAAAAIYEMVRNVEPKGVLTDADFINITGTDKRTFYANIQDVINAKVTGDVNSITKSYLPMVDRLEKKLAEKAKTVGSRYAPPTKKGQEAFKNVTQGEQATSKRDSLLNHLKGKK